MTWGRIQRLIRFAVTGVGSTLLHAAVALSLISGLTISPPLANGLAFSVATVFSYLANTLWSFSAPLHGKNLQRFLGVSTLGFFLATALAWFAESWGWSALAGITLVVCVVPAVSFVLHSQWTYR